MHYKACILLGSNLGDRYLQLQTAEKHLQARIGTMLLCSGIYATQAWGKKDQPDFLNKVVQVETGLPPTALLECLLEIEKIMGRLPGIKWGPRIIDLDLLFYDQLVYSDSTLTIPHPGIPYRRFTLAPLVEIIPDFIHPVFGKTIREMADACTDDSEVKPAHLTAHE